MVSSLQTKEEGLNININHNYFNSKFIIENRKNQLLHNLLSSEDLMNDRSKDGNTKMTYRSGQFFKTISNDSKNAYSLKKRTSYISTHSNGEESSFKLQYNQTLPNYRSPKDFRKSLTSSIHTYEQLVPCTNCGKLVKIEDVEVHTDLCTIVKEEIVVSEISNNQINIINFKLDKLEENCSQVITETNNQTDISNMNLLKQIISLGIRSNTSESIVELKSMISQIDTLLQGFKGSFLSLILYERVNVILREKCKLLSNDSPLKLKVRGHEPIRDSKIRHNVQASQSPVNSIKSAPKIKKLDHHPCIVQVIENKRPGIIEFTPSTEQTNQVEKQKTQLQEEILPPVEQEGEEDAPQLGYYDKEDPKVFENLNPSFIENKDKAENYDVSKIEKINNDDEDEENRLDETNNLILMKIFSPNVVNEINSIINSNASCK